MLLDELIRMMIGMNDDQLRKIKSFILMKLSIKDPSDTKETSVRYVKVTILSKTAREMANSNFSAKSASTLSVYPPIPSPIDPIKKFLFLSRKKEILQIRFFEGR